MRSRALHSFFVLTSLFSVLWAERTVDPVNAQEQIIVVVPLVGAGTLEDPKRPLFAPTSGSFDGKGILGYTFVMADDGRSAIVRFTAADLKAFAPILADSRVLKAFQKGKDKAADLEKELKKYKASFDLEAFAGRAK